MRYTILPPRLPLFFRLLMCVVFGVSSSLALAQDPSAESKGNPKSKTTAAADSPSADDLVELAIELQKEGQYDEAMAKLEQAIQLDPQHARAYIYRGLVKTQQGDPRAGLRDQNKAFELGERSEELFNERGWSFYKLKLYHKCLESSQEALKINPRSAQARSARGLAKSELKDEQGALEEFRLAIEADPTFESAYNNRAILHAKMGNHEAAIADYGKAIELDSDDPYPYNNRANLLVKLGRLDKAKKDYDSAIRIEPRYSHAYGNRGLLHDRRGQFLEAIADFDQCLKLNPQLDRYYFDRALVKLKIGHLASAYKDVNTYIQRERHIARGFSLRGRILLLSDHDTEAVADFTRALERDPLQHDALRYRARSLRKLGDRESALSDLNAMLRNCYPDCLGRCDRASLKFDMGNYKGVVEEMDEFLEHVPSYTLAYVLRGKAKLVLKDYDGALEDFKAAQQRNLGYRTNPEVPTEAVLHYLLGATYHLGKNDPQRALAELNKSVAISDTYHKSRIYRAIIKKELHDYPGAIADYNAMIKQYPELCEAYSGRGDAKVLMKDYQGGVEDYTTAIRLAPRWRDPYLYRSIAKEYLKDFDGALADYKMAMQLASKDNDSRFVRRRVAKLESGDASGFQEDANELLPIGAENPFAHIARSSSEQLRHGGNDNLDAKAHYWRGTVRYNKRDFAGALEDLSAAFKQAPNDPSVCRVLGLTLAQHDKLPQALEMLSKAIELKPELAYLYNDRARWRTQTGDLQGALADLTRCLELHKDNAKAYATRGIVRVLQGDFDQAMTDFDHSLTLNPGAPHHHFMRARLLQDQTKWDEARAGFKKVLELQIIESPLRRLRSRAALRLWFIETTLGKHEAATAALQRMEDWTDTSASDDIALQVAKFVRGEIDAKALIEYADKAGPRRRFQRCTAHYWIGAVALLANKKQEANRAFRRCLDTGNRLDGTYQSAAYHLVHTEPLSQGRKATGRKQVNGDKATNE